MKKLLLVSVLLGSMMVECSQHSQPTEHYVLKYYIDYDKKYLKLDLVMILKETKRLLVNNL